MLQLVVNNNKPIASKLSVRKIQEDMYAVGSTKGLFNNVRLVRFQVIQGGKKVG